MQKKVLYSLSAFLLVVWFAARLMQAFGVRYEMRSPSTAVTAKGQVVTE